MNKLIRILFFSLISVNILFAINLTKEEKEWIEHNTISIGVEQWEPMIYFNKHHEIDGITGDVIKLISKRLNLKTKIVASKWDYLLTNFKKGNIDLLPATYFTKQRATYGLYSKEYFKMKEYIYIKTNNNYISNFEDLKGKKIAIIKDYGTIPKIRKKFPTIQIVETNNMKQSVKFALEGKVDALVDAQIGVENFMSKNVVVGLKGISQDSFKASPIYFFSNIKKPILQSILQKGLDTITPLEQKEIVDKWLNRENIKQNELFLVLKNFDYSFALQVLGIVFLFTLFFIYRNAQLKKHNKDLENLNNTLAENMKLQESNDNFQDILDGTMEMIIFCNENRIITEVNNSCVKILGYDNKDEIINRDIFEFIPKDKYQISKTNMDQEVLPPVEFTVLKKDNTLLYTLNSSKYIMRNGKKMRMLTMVDISEVKQQQKLLEEQSRLAQMGEMISMIAHQWRQPLTAISATSNDLTMKIMLDNYDKDYFSKKLEKVASLSQHLSSTIDDFRDFYKEDKEKREIIYKDIIASALSIVSVSIENKNIELKTDFNCKKKINIYPNELRQVILNLIKNAEDVLIEKNIPKPYIHIKTYDDKGYSYFKVSDNGGGIPKEIMDKIFDPYFSTKTKKDGTGLGLYMSKTIIEDHCGGELKVYNDENGAVFEVKL